MEKEHKHGKRNEKVDAVIVGFGWAGSIMAKELTEAGLHVVALERGPHRDTYPDGSYPQVIDELTYNVRKSCSGSVEKHRHHSSQRLADRAALSSAGGVSAGYRHRRRRPALVRRPFSRRSDRAADAQPL